MAALNETPRQKMMGILYLVLLGLAATTVTDHVLDAFHNLTVSMETSSKNVQSTVDATFKSFEATNLKNDAVRAAPVHKIALELSDTLNHLNQYISDLRHTLEKAGGDTVLGGDVKDRADVDVSPRLMIKQGRAAELKKRIDAARAFIFKTLTPAEQQGMKMSLSAENPPRKFGIGTKWEEQNFGEGIPLTAAITALTKIQADLKNTQNEVVRKVLERAGKVDIVMDKFRAVAIPKSTYVLSGQQYQADVFLTASSSTSNPEISVGGQQLKVADGKGVYTVAASGSGERKWTGIIRVKKNDGSIDEYKTEEQSYTVAPPSATVSPTKLNVFYIGVDNPVSVSAPGIGMDKVHVSISSGSIAPTSTPGNYTVKVAALGEVTVTVTGEYEKGKSTTLGTSKFRVKRIPPPHLKFGGKGGGKMSAAAMKQQNKVFAVIEDFEFDAPFNIQHMTMYITKPRAEAQVYESTSGSFTPAMVAGINSLTPGSKVYFDLVTGVGVDGVKRQLDPIIFNVE